MQKKCKIATEENDRLNKKQGRNVPKKRRNNEHKTVKK